MIDSCRHSNFFEKEVILTTLLFLTFIFDFFINVSQTYGSFPPTETNSDLDSDSKPIITLYYAQLFPLVQIQIWIPVQRVSRMVTVPTLGTDLRPRDPNPNPSPLVEMSY